MNDYKFFKQQEGFWRLDDAKGGSMYLVEGVSRAVLFDTGMAEGSLTDALNTLTNKPVDLVLTHAHIDHMYRYGDFQNIYINETEKTFYTKKSQRLMDIGSLICRVKRNNYPVSHFKSFKNGETLDLGGIKIKAFTLGGHTPGSSVFINEAHKAVFCGDAVGSGAGVWMFLADALSLTQYRQQLEDAVEYLKPYENFSYYAGHFEQGMADDAFPVTYETFCDMLSLCKEIEKSGEKAAYKKIPVLNLLCCKFKSASMIISKRKMRGKRV